MRPPPTKHWFNAEKGEVHRLVFEYVQKVEADQFDTFDRFVKMEALYDPNSAAAIANGISANDAPGMVIENVIAANVDTVCAQIATAEVRPRILVDDANWSTARTAQQLEWYTEQVGKQIGIHDACKRAFRSAAKKGTGVVKVFTDAFGEVRAEAVRIDDIVVDEAECRNGGLPRQMHRRMTCVDREELKAMFPDMAEEIDEAQSSRPRNSVWAGYRPIVDGELVVIESHRLPTGRKGKPGYKPGRHTITADGVDLLDEPYEKAWFPYACVTWTEREAAFYGISLSEGIAGIQRALNKRNLQIDRQLDQHAFPTTWVSMADAHLAVQTISRAGTIVPVKGERPKTEVPQAVGGEVFAHRQALKDAAAENSGVSRMASQAVKPAGIDSGVAMREYKDQTTQRFAPQEQSFEELELHCHFLAIDCCKDLGADAPQFYKKAKFGSKKVKWKDVDMRDVKVQLSAASTLSRGAAGRAQAALEMAQAGVIDTDEYRMLLEHPDLERIISVYTQARKCIEADIEAMEDQFAVTPEPYGNLAMMIRMGQMAYQRDRDLDGCPEEVLEALRQYVVIAADMLEPAPAPSMGMGEAAGMPPGAMPAGPPQAALAPQAMSLVAG